jgi:hypothetical protein
MFTGSDTFHSARTAPWHSAKQKTKLYTNCTPGSREPRSGGELSASVLYPLGYNTLGRDTATPPSLLLLPCLATVSSKQVAFFVTEESVATQIWG